MPISVERITNECTDLMAVNAARVSFGRRKDTFDSNDAKLINYLVKHNHWSPLAHPHLSVQVDSKEIDLDDIITDKSMLAGLNISIVDDIGSDRKLYTFTGSVWALAQLSSVLGSQSLWTLLCAKCPAITAAIETTNGDTFFNNFQMKEGPLFYIVQPPKHHQVFTFYIKAPIFVARQLVKHQVGLVWNEVSRRYVDTPPEVEIPGSWRGRPQGNIKQGSDERTEIVLESFIANPLLNAVAYYNDLVGYGVAPEQARMVLPLATYTEWYWTGTREAFERVIQLRTAGDAQKETREVVDLIRGGLQ